MDSMNSAVLLSRGGTWNPRPQDPPYLIPVNSGLNAWPTGASVKAVFTDSNGGTLATLRGKVTPELITFSGSPKVMDPIPAGANFVITLQLRNGETYPIRYGQVIRKEPFYARSTPIAASPLQFADTFQRTALGTKYKVTYGRLQMVDNSDASLPTGVAAASTTGGAAMRFEQEFTSDTVEIGVTLLNRTTSTSAWTGVTLCADINQETGLCVQFVTGSSSARKIHIGSLTDPVTVIDQVAPVALTVVNLDYYLIRYVDATATVSVYRGTALDTPIISWTDNAGLLPHGPGYRHLGANFQRVSTSTKGIQLTSMAARDAA